MMSKNFLMSSFAMVFAVAASTPAAYAQYDFWAGQISNAQRAQISTISNHVDNLILQDVIDQQLRSAKVTKSQRNAASHLSASKPNFANVYSQLDFRHSSKVRSVVVNSLIDQTKRGNAEAGRQMEKLFTTGGFVQALESALSSYDMKPNNLADSYSVWMVNMYSAARGNSTPKPAATMKAVRDQVARSFLSMPKFISSPDAEKQLLSDELLLRGAIVGGGLASFAEGSSERREYMRDVRETAKKSGFDVDTVILTSDGFVPVKGR
jgi:hypothetical protein